MKATRKFTIDVKCAAETNIDLDCSPDTKEDELATVISWLKKLDFNDTKFKVVNLKFTEELASKITSFLKEYATIDKVAFLSDTEFIIAFLVAFDHKDA